MVVVLYGHSLEILFLERPDGAFEAPAFVQYKVLASFVMALFFLLSGASAANLAGKGWRSVVRTSLYLVVIAYLVHALGLFALAIQAFLDGGEAPARWLVDAVDSTLKGRDFSTIVVWFLVSLAAVRLIVYGLLATLPARLAHAAVGFIALASLATPWLPNVMMAKTWPVGVAFFALGMVLAPRLKHRGWVAGLVLAPALVWLALHNNGCAFDPVAMCPAHGLPDEAVVWLHIGQTGFMPLFFLTALLGCIVVLAVAHALVLAGATLSGPARLLGWIGRHTLELLVLNGFILVLVQPALKTFPMPDASLWLYPLLVVAVVGLHLLALKLLARPLAALQRLAFRLSDLVMELGIARAPAIAWRAASRR